MLFICVHVVLRSSIAQTLVLSNRVFSCALASVSYGDTSKLADLVQEDLSWSCALRQR